MNCERVDSFRAQIALTELGVPMENPLAIAIWGACETTLKLGANWEDTGTGSEKLEGKACGGSASGVPGVISSLSESSEPGS